MVEVLAISRKVLVRLSSMNYELGGGSFTEQLIFPKKIQGDGSKHVDRVSEQELRHLFIEEFRNAHREFFYSIETPTIEKYRFRELHEDKENLKQSALHDMSVFEREGESLKRVLNIEFKHKAAFKSIEKDIIKLIVEQQDGAFILLLQNTDSGTLKSVLMKFSESFNNHKLSWKGGKRKIIQIIVLSLERQKEKKKIPFLMHCEITENDLTTPRLEIGKGMVKEMLVVNQN